MNRATLTEYQTLTGVALTQEQRSLLGLIAPSISITRSFADEAAFDLTPGSWIGAIALPGLHIEIRPKIPIDRVAFILSYALDPKQWHKSQFDFAEDKSLLEAIIPGFIYHLKQAIRRGLLQGYRTEEDALATIRGRIRFEDQMKKRHGVFPPIEVRYDDFTEDIVENRLLKSAIWRLRKMRIRSEWARGLLRANESLFGNVSLVEYNSRSLPEVIFTRLNAHYLQAIELAKMILRSTTWELAEGRSPASAFLVDMNVLFEDFVITALREALHVDPRSFPQGARGKGLKLDTAGRITLRPDLSWWDGPICRFVGDVKYKKVRVEGIENPDVYQLLAYTIATDLPEGLLVYAQGEEEPITHDIRHSGKVLKIASLDLSAEIPAILDQIKDLAEQVRHMRRQSEPRRVA